MDGMVCQFIEGYSREKHYSIFGYFEFGKPTAAIVQMSLSAIETYRWTPDAEAEPIARCYFLGYESSLIGYVETHTDGRYPTTLVASGIRRVDYVLEVRRCSAKFQMNYFLWPSVTSDKWD